MSEDSDQQWEQILKAGVGAFLLAKDRITEELDKILEEKGIDEEEKKDIKSKLLERAEQETGKMQESARKKLEAQVEKAGFARQEDLEEIKKRLDAIEEKLEEE